MNTIMGKSSENPLDGLTPHQLCIGKKGEKKSVLWGGATESRGQVRIQTESGYEGNKIVRGPSTGSG